ncbi:hypothetical protein GCM10027320_23210 [Massilia solisilvae]
MHPFGYALSVLLPTAVCFWCFNYSNSKTVVPAQAGTHRPRECTLSMGPRLRGDDVLKLTISNRYAAGLFAAPTDHFICGNANSTPLLAVFGQRCITALWRV